MDQADEGLSLKAPRRTVSIDHTFIRGNRVYTETKEFDYLDRFAEADLYVSDGSSHNPKQLVAVNIPVQNSEWPHARSIYGATVIFEDTQHKVPLNDGWVRDVEDILFILVHKDLM